MKVPILLKAIKDSIIPIHKSPIDVARIIMSHLLSSKKNSNNPVAVGKRIDPNVRNIVGEKNLVAASFKSNIIAYRVMQSVRNAPYKVFIIRSNIQRVLIAVTNKPK